MEYNKIKEAVKAKNLKIKLLKDSIKFVNVLLSVKGARENKKKYFDNLEKLNEMETMIIKLKRNKYNSSAYEFKPFIGLNRQQRRRL